MLGACVSLCAMDENQSDEYSLCAGVNMENFTENVASFWRWLISVSSGEEVILYLASIVPGAVALFLFGSEVFPRIGVAVPVFLCLLLMLGTRPVSLKKLVLLTLLGALCFASEPENLLKLFSYLFLSNAIFLYRKEP